MRAVVYHGSGGPDVAAVADVPPPELGSDDALVAVAYAGLNRADLLERAGRYPRPPGVSSIPGLEFSGVVRALGAGASGPAALAAGAVAVGDRVAGLVPAGAHAQLVATNALALARLPAGVTLRDAAAIPEAFITAYDALVTRGGFAFGDSVVVHAVGSSVGLAAVALVAAAGGVALGTSRTPGKLERARAHGLAAGFALDDRWVASVLAATGGRGVDVILDFVGAPTLAGNLQALAPNGRIVQIGTLGGAEAAIPLHVLMQKRAALHGTVLRSRPLEERIALAKHLQRALLPRVAAGALRVEIDRVFPLDEVRAAHERMEADANFGKVVLALDGDAA